MHASVQELVVCVPCIVFSLCYNTNHQPCSTHTHTEPNAITNQQALCMLDKGEFDTALKLQSDVTLHYKQYLSITGMTSNDYLDVAGAIADEGAVHLSLKNFELAEKSTKRALMMAERAYKPNPHLLQCLRLSQLEVLMQAPRREEEALVSLDKL